MLTVPPMGRLTRTIPLSLRATLQHLLTPWVRRSASDLRRSPPLGKVRFGDLRRCEPISRHFGRAWGQCIDRYYIEHFLARHAADIHGCVLEVADNHYTRRFGGARVRQSEVLHVSPDEPQATLVADLTCADHLPSAMFDCIVLTQTLQFIYDVRAALHTLHRLLKPAGVLLATTHGISQIARWDMDHWGEYWRFTTRSAHRLVSEIFPPETVAVQAYGNVLAATAFLQGLVAEELRPAELDYFDPDYELLVTIRAMKP